MTKQTLLQALYFKIAALTKNLLKSIFSFGVAIGIIVLIWLMFQPGFFNRIGLLKPTNIRVGVVRPVGAAGLIAQNKGFKPNEETVFFEEYGFVVSLIPLKDEAHARDMLLYDSIDIADISTATFAKYSDTLNIIQPKLFMLAGWSRGNDALIVRKGVEEVVDLFERPVAYIPHTSQFYFLRWLLKWTGLEEDEVQEVAVDSEAAAMQSFVEGKSQAVVLSSINVEKCIDLVSGDAQVLQTTETASHILDHSYWVTEKFYDKYQQKVHYLTQEWLKGNALMKHDEESQKVVLGVLEQQYGWSGIQGSAFLQNTYLAGYQDNLNYLGISNTFTGLRAKDIYEYTFINNHFTDSLKRANKTIRQFHVVVDTTTRTLFDVQSLELFSRRNKRRIYRASVTPKLKKSRQVQQVVFESKTDYSPQNFPLKGSGYYMKYQKAIKSAAYEDGFILEPRRLDNIADISFEFDEINGLTATYQYLSVQEDKLKPQDLGITIPNKLKWKHFITTDPLKSFKLSGEFHLAEKLEYRTQSIQRSQKYREASSIATYQLEVKYPDASIRLPVEAKTKLDADFLLMSKIFGKCMIRVEGRADGWEDEQKNNYFAYKRAEAIANYLVAEHHFEPRRFIILGNDTISTNRVLSASTEYDPTHWINLSLLSSE